MRKLCALVLALVLAVCVTTPAALALDTSATSAILIDGETGRVLYAENAQEERAIASITKLMTVLVAVESGHDLQEVVEIKREYTGVEGSSMYLREGEQLTLEELLYGLMLSSGNDAAVAVADWCGGSVEAFVDQMNRKAALLGMEHTHFENPHGLTQDGHYSTAEDMAKLAAACMKNETVARLAATKSITVAGRTLTNHNKLLWNYEGCVGMKTGYTEKAGRTLISCAQRNGQTLIVVTLNDPNDWADHTALLDYGFATYTRTVLQEAGQVQARVPVTGSLLSFAPVVAADQVVYPLAEGETIREEVSLIQWTQAPVEQGQSAGTITYYLGDEIVGVSRLVYGAAVSHNVAGERGFFQRLLDRFLSIT